MKSFFLSVLTFCSIISSQDKIIVLRINERNKIQEIEKNIFENVAKLYEKRYQRKVEVIERKVENFQSFFKELNKNKSEKDEISAMGAISITKERLKDYDFSVTYLPAKEVILGLKSYWKNRKFHFKDLKLAYTKKSIQEKYAKDLQKNYASEILGYKVLAGMIQDFFTSKLFGKEVADYYRKNLLFSN